MEIITSSALGLNIFSNNKMASKTVLKQHLKIILHFSNCSQEIYLGMKSLDGVCDGGINVPCLSEE